MRDTPFMFLLALVVTIGALIGTGYCVRASSAQEDGQEGQSSQEQKITDPKFVVVCNFQSRASDPLINLRVVIHAKSESDAIVRATLYVNKQFGNVIDMDKLRFVEAAPARVDAEQPPKK